MDQTASTLAFVFVVAVANLLLGYGVGHVARGGKLPAISWPQWRRKPKPPVEVEVSFDFDSLGLNAADSPPPAEAAIKRSGTFAEALAKAVQNRSAYAAEMVEFADQLRETLAAPACEPLQAHSVRLEKISQGYLEQLNGSMRFFKRRKPPAPDAEQAERLYKRLDGAWQVINETMISLVGFQCTDENLADSIVRLETAAGKLLLAAFQLRDELETAVANAVRDGHGAVEDFAPEDKSAAETSPEEMAAEEEKTTLPNVLGRWQWEAAYETVRQSPPEAGPACVGLVDLDEAARWPREIGWAATERLLAAIEKAVSGTLGEGVPAHRLRGQQWAFCLPQSPPEVAAERLERVRQSVEKTQFTIGERELHVTVSGAVMPVSADVDAETALERLRVAVREAKTAGRNRTFLCEDSPKPVVPPVLEIEAQTLAV